MDSLKADEAGEMISNLIEKVAMSHEPILIAGKKGNGVLLSEDDWRSVQETLYLLSIPGMRESIREGLATPVDECATELQS